MRHQEKTRVRPSVVAVVLLLLGGGVARGDAPLVFCEGRSCGGGGERDYCYRVEATRDPLLEFRVGSNDLDPAHYRNLLTPPGWSFTVEDLPMAHAHGVETRHGEVSPGPCYCLTEGSVHWWTDDPRAAIEVFTFGFDQGSSAEDLGWELLSRREGPPPEFHRFAEDWGAPLGSGMGPLHGPFECLPTLHLGAEERVSAEGLEIEVPGYSVPLLAPWDGDVLPDLRVGEGGSYEMGKVRVYRNVGVIEEPLFAGFDYVQSEGADLEIPGSGCLGLFPRLVWWDGDARKDLLIGLSSGEIWIYLNVGSDEEPTFDGGSRLEVGPPGAKVPINVGGRATALMVDWNRDGLEDLLSGAMDGRVRVFLNVGAEGAPDFLTASFARTLEGADLEVPSGRSSPCVADFTGDRRRDLLCGNTEGELLLYENLGSDDDPLFAEPLRVSADDVPIDIGGRGRSRPSVCDWSARGEFDLLVGAGDGLVRLYQGLEMVPYRLSAVPEPLIAGQEMTLTLSGAAPLSLAAAGFSLLGLGQVDLPPLELVADLAQPRWGGLGRADESGRVVWRFEVPPEAAGRELWLQSGQFQRKSHVLVTEIR
jgi:hypothetical protein